MTKTTSLLASFLAVGVSNAAVLVDWNLDTITGPTENNTEFTGVSSATASVAANISVSDLTTDGLPLESGATVDPGLVWSSGSPAAGELNLQRWDRPVDGDSTSFGTGNGVPDNWLVFSLSADPGFSFALDKLTVSAWRNGGGAPEDWAYQYSSDGGTNWNAFGSVHTESNAGDSVFRSVEFTDSVSASDLQVRFIATGPEGGTGNIHIDGMTAEGTVVPEPTVAVLGAFGLLGLLRRRR